MENSIIESASNYDVLDIINRGIAYAIIAAGFLSVIFILWGGFLFILSGGNEEKIKKAVGTIRYAIIGLVITIFAVVIVGLVGRFLDLDILQYLDINEVFENVQSLTGNLGEDSSSRGVRSLD